MKMIIQKTLGLVAALFVLSSLAMPADAAAPSKEQSANKRMATSPALTADYTIGTEDLLSINVWKEPEVSRIVPVRPDGKISLPLVGDMDAVGLTPKQLQANLTRALQSYIANPEVTVIVQEVRSLKFNVLGEVAHPGSFNLSKPTTVLDALALAGGFREFAKTSKIYVLRVRPDGSQVRIPFNYKDVIKGGRLEQNVELEARDTIIVP